MDASCSIVDRNHVLNNQSPTQGLAVSFRDDEERFESNAIDQCRQQVIERLREAWTRASSQRFDPTTESGLGIEADVAPVPGRLCRREDWESYQLTSDSCSFLAR